MKIYNFLFMTGMVLLAGGLGYGAGQDSHFAEHEAALKGCNEMTDKSLKLAEEMSQKLLLTANYLKRCMEEKWPSVTQ